MSGRLFDPIYDTTYVASSARDHYRQQTVAGGFMVERAPEYSNMFSKLPQYPSTTFRLKNSDRVPAFVDRTFHPDVCNPADLNAASRPEVVAGTERYKYFRRPLLSMPTNALVKEATVLPLTPPPLPPPIPKAKTVGTQSDYRESEAQTTPWEPLAVVPEVLSAKQQHLREKYHCVEHAELMYLKDLKFGDGLPPGMHEIWRIEKLRAKRAFEATLPPLNDIAQLPLRQKMIEEWESEEWKEREDEIHGIHNERLDLLEQALLVREEELDEATMHQVEARKKLLLEQKSSKFASIQANRIKTMRQLVDARKYVEKPRKLHKQTIVERYANFGSTAYAPVQREGRFPEAKPQGKTIETEGYQPLSLPGVVELENYLPARLLNPRVADLSKPTKMDYKQRQEAAIQRDLKVINDLLDTAKATKGRGFGECWPAPLKNSDLGLTMLPGGRAAAVAATLRAAHQANAKASAPKTKTGIRGAADRPEATEIPPGMQHGTDGERNAAAILLQRLLRGRAVQNVLFEGKTRRLELIQELRIAASPQAATTRPEDAPGIAHELDALLGTVVSGLAAAMALEDPKSRADALAAALDPNSQTLPPDFDVAAAAASAAQHLHSGIEGDAGFNQQQQHGGGALWLRHMEAAQRGNVPAPAKVVAAEMAAAEQARGVRPMEDDTPRNFELLMQEMTGLTYAARRPSEIEQHRLGAPEQAGEMPVRREDRAAAAAAAAEARFQASHAARPEPAGGFRDVPKPLTADDSEAGEEGPGSAEAVHGGEKEERKQGTKTEQQHEGGTLYDRDTEAKVVKIQALQRKREAQRRVEQIRQQRQQQQQEEGAAPEEPADPEVEKEADQGHNTEAKAGQQGREEGAGEQEQQEEEEMEGGGEQEGEGGSEKRTWEEPAASAEDQGNGSPPAAESSNAEQGGEGEEEGLPREDEGEDERREVGEQEEQIVGLFREGDQGVGGHLGASRHSEDLLGEPSFGGQARGEQQGEGEEHGEEGGEDEQQEEEGGVTLDPMHEKEQELDTEPSLGHTLGENEEQEDRGSHEGEGMEEGDVTLKPPSH